MCMCSVCRRSFPEDRMYSYSPGGLRKVYECPECHDRGTNRVDVRAAARRRKMYQASRESRQRQ